MERKCTTEIATQVEESITIWGWATTYVVSATKKKLNMIGNKSNPTVEGLKCYGSDEGYEIAEIDYGVRLTSRKGAYLLDIWAKHTKGGAVKHFTVHDWVTDKWHKPVGYNFVEQKILEYRKYLDKEHRQRPEFRSRRVY